MIRVMCIDGNFINEVFSRESFKYVNQTPKEGNVYTVSKQVLINGIVGYILNEINGGTFPSGRPVTFHYSRFILLSPEVEENVFKAELFLNN